MGREMTSLCGFMEDWTMQHINCWDMPQTRQVLIDISYLPFSAWSLAGVPGWRRTNMNSLLHTVTSRRKVHRHSKEGKPPHPLWSCQLTHSLLQSRVNQLGVGRNWIPHWERWLRHFRNWVENVSRHFAKPFLFPCYWTWQPADSLRTGGFVEGAPHPPKELRLTEQRTRLDTCLRAKSLSPVWVTKCAQSCSTLGDPMDCSPPGSSRQEYWSGLLCPPPGDLPHPGIKPRSVTSTCLGRWVLY